MSAGRVADRFELARVTLEFTTPFAVRSGSGDDLVDSVFVVDANGLPTIPGSSLAGILRHALATGDPERDPRCRAVFGFVRRRSGGSADAAASRVHVSWGQVHGTDDRPVSFLAPNLERDELLGFLAAGIRRNHVRLNARGVHHEDRALFDELLVPAGARFTFEIRLDLPDPEAPPELRELLQLLARRTTTIGGRTRAGLGDFRIVRYGYRLFDLAKAEDFRDFRRLPKALEDKTPPGVLPEGAAIDGAAPAEDVVTATLRLQAEDFFLVGDGEMDLQAPDDLNARKRKLTAPRGEQAEEVFELPDMVPYRERHVVWSNGRGSVSQIDRSRGAHAVIPASGIKGALRHRTAFHARRLRGPKAWIDADDAESIARAAESDWCEPDSESAICELFGEIKQRADPNDGGGSPQRAGRIYVDEVRIDRARTVRLQHVSIDRFSGGPMDGALFDEMVLQFEDPITLRVHVEAPREVDALSRAAFSAALSDLCEGRLALGAASARGHGYFRGTIIWSDESWAKASQ